MTRATFDAWLRGTYVLDVEENTLIVAVKNEYAVEWLTHRLYPIIVRTLSRITEQPFECRFVVNEPIEPEKEPLLAIEGGHRAWWWS